MAVPENRFPTIRDVRDRLAELVDKGLGDLPVQIVVMPDSTMQAIAKLMGGHSDKPALMIDLSEGDGPRLPVTLISTDRFTRSGMETTKSH